MHRSFIGHSFRSASWFRSASCFFSVVLCGAFDFVQKTTMDMLKQSVDHHEC